MSTQVNRRNTLYGYPNPQAGLQQEPIVQLRDPLASDTAELGTIWVNTVSQSFFILCSSGSGTNVWTATTGGSETLTALTVNPGNITVTAGDVDISAGDLNMAPASTATVGTLSAGATTVGSTLGVTGNTTIGGTLGVTGSATFNSDVTIDGNVTLNGDFDLTSADAILLTTTSDTAPAIGLTANGGTAETILINSIQGTTTAAIELLSTVGGITLQAGKATPAGIFLFASNAAGNITAVAGTGGITMATTDGVFSIATGTGSIDISNDSTATNINIGTGVGSIKMIDIGGTGANVIRLGDLQTGGSVDIGTAMTTGTISIGGTGLQTGTVSIAPGTGAQTVNIATGGTGVKTVNIATGAIDNVVTIGSLTGAAETTINAGTAGMTIGTTGTMFISSTGAFAINAASGAINIGNIANAQPINIGTAAAARTITVGNATGATSVVVNVGTGALNLGTNATVHATAVGSVTAGCTLALNTPVGTPVVANAGISITDLTSANSGLTLPAGIQVLSGTGDPNGIVTAPIGSLYLRVDPAGATSRAYINTDAGTTWTNITCAA